MASFPATQTNLISLLPWSKDFVPRVGRVLLLKALKSGKRNVGMYRMQVYDGQTTGMHWQRQKVAAEHRDGRQNEAAEAEAGEGDKPAPVFELPKRGREITETS